MYVYYSNVSSDISFGRHRNKCTHCVAFAAITNALRYAISVNMALDKFRFVKVIICTLAKPASNRRSIKGASSPGHFGEGTHNGVVADIMGAVTRCLSDHNLSIKYTLTTGLYRRFGRLKDNGVVGAL